MKDKKMFGPVKQGKELEDWFWGKGDVEIKLKK